MLLFICGFALGLIAAIAVHISIHFIKTPVSEAMHVLHVKLEEVHSKLDNLISKNSSAKK